MRFYWMDALESVVLICWVSIPSDSALESNSLHEILLELSAKEPQPLLASGLV